MIKTLLTNNLNTARQITWAGVQLGAKESILLDGALPYSSKKHRAMSAAMAEVADGTTSIAYITEQPTMTLEEYGQSLTAAKAKAVQAKKEEAAKVEEPPADDKEADEVPPVVDAPETDKKEAQVTGDVMDNLEGDDVFRKGSIEDALKETRAMPGTETAVIENGQTAKVAVALGAEVATVKEATDKGKLADPLKNLGSVIGDDAKPAEMSPSAEKLAKEANLTNVQLCGITATGKDGSLIKSDIQKYIKNTQ